MKTNIGLIYKKEFSSFFNSAVAYITLIVFLLLAGWFSMNTFFLINQSDLRQLFSVIPIIYLAFIPALTMNLIAEEKNDGTMEFLTTLPVSDADIVVGKFLASMALIGIALLFTFTQFFTVLIIGNNVDIGALLCGYIGLLLLGGVYSAIGLFASSITDNQIVAFIVSFLIIAIFFILDKILMFVPGFLSTIFQYMSTGYHFESISRGVIDSRNIIYFASIITFFLLLSIRVLEMRKWR
ncbi:MAG: ABC transporter permease subunit [Candidatus Marinimicrobia bacterium]|nr:ABC transporter permease subunit [Candidatus Neomarinimicrobiota bacterium]